MVENPIINTAITDLVHIDRYIEELKGRLQAEVTTSGLPEEPDDIRPMRDVKRDYILNAVEVCGSINKAADRLKMNRKTIATFCSEQKERRKELCLKREAGLSDSKKMTTR